jgi:acyl-[acyl-carrier-protein]-phospholipid O-acyltransferase/long-chain-fatty-acid--[acyl-carrier-protein] ligase
VPAPTPSPLRGLLGAQFLAAFNDNLLRVVVILLLVATRDTEVAQQQVTTWAFAAFTLPFLVFSIPAGTLADRFSKRSVLVGLKVFEIVVMALCTWALVDGRPWPVLGVLALLGMQASLFSPVKYSILPELLPPARLTRANGELLLWTYLAIISGTAAGGVLLDLLRHARWAIGLVLLSLAGLGLAFALKVPRVPAAGKRGGPFATARAGWFLIRTNRRLRMGTVANLAFWTLAGLLQQDLVVYSKAVLGISDSGKGVLLASLALGIGVGSLAAGLAGRDRIVLGHIPLGAAGMSLATGAFGYVVPGFWPALGLLFLLGFSAGFYVVPVNAWMQAESPPHERGAVLAVLNVLVFSGILIGSLAAVAMAWLGLDSPAILLVAAVLSAVGTLYAVVRGPDPAPEGV